MKHTGTRSPKPRAFATGRPACGFLAVAMLLYGTAWGIGIASAQRPDPAGLFALQRDFIHITEKLTPSVVRVASRYTGVIVDGRGYVLSDLAAVPESSQSTTRIPVELASGRIVDAVPVHRSRQSRTALLKILKGARYPNIPAGDSDELRVGDLAITIGNAFNQAQQGGQPAVTVGHVAGLWSASTSHDGIKVGRIVTTAAINPGTSGGPLIDIRGSLIGINDQRRDTGDMGQVMPINFIRESYAQCEEAYRVLSLGAQKRGRPRTYANYMDQAVIDVARQATRAVVSLRITRKDPPDKAKPADSTGKKDDRATARSGEKKKSAPESSPPEEKKPAEPPQKIPDPKAAPDKKPAQDKPAPEKTDPSADPRPPLKERRDGVVPLKITRPPAPQPRNRPPQKRPTFKLKRREDPVSGVVVSPKGLILTATANLWETDQKKIDRIDAILDDGRVVQARKLGTDRTRGLTLIEIPATDLPVLEEPKQGETPVGSFVAALGNPYGTRRHQRESFLTWGVLSARNQLDPGKAALQTDAWINQANQGGALVDMRGRLLGITVLFQPARYGINSGVGFAIPLWSVRRSLHRLEKGEDVYPGYLGVRLPPVYEPEIRGVRIVEVVKHSPADRAGLKPGDHILSVNGRTTLDMRAVLVVLGGLCEDDQAELEIERKGLPQIVRITAARRG